ncbi:Six-hairpin glycosidase [Rhizoclosmatium globosum]|uniref:cellulase n=1 Tax=Rhizoclosmatium globosum TaxID=329046 RepID=A0A1Y2C4G3_9FUNG|nr:Six-hairpin glycosidase [Rhizoclosmatium globosum]|eukprot:ORY41901.1 Six-hairpin glycosidase [Rhizoclosmatium globosum]
MSQPDPYVIHLENGQRSSVILNHIGFNTHGPKTFLVPGSEKAGYSKFELVDGSGVPVFEGSLVYAGTTAKWSVTPSVWTGDFSAFTSPGVGFRLRLSKSETVESAAIVTNGDAESKATKKAKTTTTSTTTRTSTDLVVPDIYHYFRSQRVSGKYAKKDHRVSFVAAEDGSRPEGTVDVSGGWYDASGDTSKYLSHLSYANFMNPQQTPLITWAFLEAADNLSATAGSSDRLKSFLAPLREESLYGCDFLIRMQHEDGYFYQTVFDKWSKDVNQREIWLKHTTWQAGYRQGAGLAIASLARASTLPSEFIESTTNYSGAIYLAAAEAGFKHLEIHNVSYLNDKTENIIDHYCALLAASELYAATKNEEYLHAARTRSAKLQACQVSNARPFFHASDAGLPIISLVRYAEVETDASLIAAVKVVVERAMDFEISITKQVNNPFGYPRQYVKPVDGPARASFFFPHNNESGYWWQGENARLGSLASAASKALSLLAPTLPAEKTAAYTLWRQSSIDWVLGKNPYDMCMMQGRGRRNPEYLPQYPNAQDEEGDLAFKPDPHGADWAQNWRWGEQWIPHGGYLALAVSLV